MPPYSTLKTSSDSEIGLAAAVGEDGGFAAGFGSVESSHPASTPRAARPTASTTGITEVRRMPTSIALLTDQTVSIDDR